MSKLHDAFGIYGIIEKDGQLLVINKNDGPYINRYDLPGGSMEVNELLEDTLSREINEETGLQIEHYYQLGTVAFLYPWQYEEFDVNRHTCVMYRIAQFTGNPMDKVKQFTGQDSLGSHFIDLNSINSDNSSPLVLKAKQYLLDPQNRFDATSIAFDKWHVKDFKD